MTTIYLDHAATTPMHPKAIEKLTEAMTTVYGNPSSIHQIGRTARKSLDHARKTLAESIGALPTEIIFTASGTEANNTALFGAAKTMTAKGKHIITTNVEHHAVLNTCKQLEKEGYDVTYLAADENGQISAEQVKEALTDETILVSVMYGNNEVGTIQPIEEIGALLEGHQALFHTDAVQAYGVIPIHVSELKVDLLSVSAHKLNGPKGIGFLYMRSGVMLTPLMFGGEQERKRRAGTENIPAILAFEEAVKAALENLEETTKSYEAFEQTLVETLREHGVTCTIHAQEVARLPHITNISFPGMDIESFLINLDMAGVCVSSGSACTAGSLDPSHVLTAMYGKGAAELRNSVRFSYGARLTIEDIKLAAEKTAAIVNRLVKD